MWADGGGRTERGTYEGHKWMGIVEYENAEEKLKIIV